MSDFVAAGAWAAVERLGHHDVLDMPDTHSREGRKDESAPVWHCKHGMAARRLQNFRAIHHETLRRALASLPEDGRDAGVLAMRGRILRLLGEPAAARRCLEKSLSRAPSAQAAGWLGEMAVFVEPRKALERFEQALTLDRLWPWPRLWKAAACIQLNKPAAALAELKAFQISGRKPFIYRLLSFQVFMMMKNEQAALRQAQSAIRSDPGSPAGYDIAGRVLRRLGRAGASLNRWHEARERDLDVMGSYVFDEIDVDLTWQTPHTYLSELDAAIAKQPALAPLYAERAELMRHPRFCRYEDALADYTRAVRMEPRRGWLRAVLARAMNNLHGGAAGLADFDRAVRLAPDSGWIRAWRGAVLARLGRSRPALADFDAAQKIMPWYPFTFSWRGALFNRLGRFAEARRDLDTAVRLDPRYMFSRFERYKALKGLHEFAGAVSDLNAAFASDPKYTWQGSLEELDAAVKAEPGIAWLYAWRGHRHLESGRLDSARADFDSALALETDSGLIFAWRARARRQAGDGRGALSDLKRAVRLSPGLWAAHQELARLHESRGDLRKALASMAAVTRLTPTTISCLTAKARLALSLNRFEEALADLDRALQLDVSCLESRQLKARALLARGLARQKSGNLAGQISDFRLALELSPELFSDEERRTVAGLVGSPRA